MQEVGCVDNENTITAQRYGGVEMRIRRDCRVAAVDCPSVPQAAETNAAVPPGSQVLVTKGLSDL